MRTKHWVQLWTALCMLAALSPIAALAREETPPVAVGPQYDTTHVYVAPADVDASPAIPASLGNFAGVPRTILPFPSVLVASQNDPYITPDRARLFASAWGATLFDAGACGHINVASGFGPWPQGLQILRDFAHTIQTAPAPESVSSHSNATERA